MSTLSGTHYASVLQPRSDARGWVVERLPLQSSEFEPSGSACVQRRRGIGLSRSVASGRSIGWFWKQRWCHTLVACPIASLPGGERESHRVRFEVIESHQHSFWPPPIGEIGPV